LVFDPPEKRAMNSSIVFSFFGWFFIVSYNSILSMYLPICRTIK
jgi:hypothetical protein